MVVEVRFVAGGAIRSVDEIKRLHKINCLPMITPNLVEVARKGLLFGPARTLPNNFESHS
jgi:predicted nuclease with RNAse H fold